MSRRPYKFPVPQVEELRERYLELSECLTLTARRHVDERLAEFKAAGGCETCRGRGWVLVWSDPDDECDHRTAPCPNPDCTPESRQRSGLYPANTKYDKYHVNSLWQRTEIQRDELTRLESEVRRALSAYQIEVERWKVREGALVEVIGNASCDYLPPGTFGLVRDVNLHTANPPQVSLQLVDGTRAQVRFVDVEVRDPDPDPNDLSAALGFNLTVGFPLLSTYLGRNSSGRSVRVFNVLNGQVCWLVISQINAVHVRRDGKTLNVRLRDLKDQEIAILFLDLEYAKLCGFVSMS